MVARKLELVLLGAWHTKAVKGKSGKLQLKHGSLSTLDNNNYLSFRGNNYTLYQITNFTPQM